MSLCICNKVRVRENELCVPDDDDDNDEYDGDDDDDDDDDDYDDDEETAEFITTFDRRIVCILTIKPFQINLSGFWPY